MLISILDFDLFYTAIYSIANSDIDAREIPFINIRKVTREVFALDFQHFLRNLANVNE